MISTLMKNKKTVGYAFMAAGLLLTNTACDETKERVLKMEVVLGTVSAKPIGLPDGSTADFPSVANNLFYRQVMNHDHFNIYADPSATSSTGSTSSSTVATKAVTKKASTVTAALSKYGSDDVALLTKYGMAASVAAASLKKTATGLSSKAVQMAATSTTTASTVPACVYERPLINLGTTVVSFAAEFGAGLKIGYDSTGNSISTGSPVGGSIDFTGSKMDLTVNWNDNFTKQAVVAAQGVSYASDVKFSIGAGNFPVGANFFYTTPLANTVENAFTAGLDAAVASYVTKTSGSAGTWTQAWEARVISDPSIDNDTFVAFRAGTYAGVVVGDTFTVQNQTFRWTDDNNPCTTALKYTLPDGDVLATLTVVESSSLITIAKVTPLADGAIRPGAQIKIKALYVAPATTSATATQASN